MQLLKLNLQKPVVRYSVIAVCIIGGLVLYALFFRSTEYDSAVSLTDGWAEPEEQVAEEQEAVIIVVDVKGAVKLPGVYTFPAESRVHEAISKAGGFLEDAEESAVNLALKMTDEAVVYVPKIGEVEAVPLAGTNQISSENDVAIININTASETELQALQGVGPAKASTIIQHREEHGPFQAVEDIMDVSGIGEKSFEALKTFIDVN